MTTINYIDKKLKNEFQNELFKAALSNLEDQSNRLRLNNFAYAIRELTRHILHGLAPDSKVTKCNWFEVQTENNKPTRHQRMKYAIQGGLSDNIIEEIGLYPEEILEEIKALKDVVGSLSKYTHVNEESFGVEKTLADEFIDRVFERLKTFLIIIDDTREMVTSKLEEIVIERVSDEAIFNSYENLYSLAPHFSMESAEIEDYKILSIDNEEIKFLVQGSIEIILEYGSNKDRWEGDGLEIPQNYSFETEVTFQISNNLEETITRIEVEPFGVDISDWYE